MRLYYSPGACSLASHIVAREAGLPVELSKVSFNADGSRSTEHGEDFFAVNAKGGYVPALRLQNGEVLAEGVAIMQYLADQAPEKGLMPEHGTPAYYRALEWMTYISSEIHKGSSIFFKGDAGEADKAAARARLESRFAYVDGVLASSEYLLGAFSIADAYLYTIARWSPKTGVSIAAYPALAAFMARMEARDGVALALSEEGLPASGSY